MMRPLRSGGLPPWTAGRQSTLLRNARRRLVRALRPQAVALVDALGHEDYVLNSALGRRDGDVYTV